MAGVTLPYDNLNDVRFRLEEVAPHLVRYGDVEPANFFAQALEMAKVRIAIRHDLNFRKYENNNVTYICCYICTVQKQPGGSFSPDPVDINQKTLDQFFMTDVVSRASLTMAKCVQAVMKQRQSAA